MKDCDLISSILLADGRDWIDTYLSLIEEDSWIFEQVVFNLDQIERPLYQLIKDLNNCYPDIGASIYRRYGLKYMVCDRVTRTHTWLSSILVNGDVNGNWVS